MQAKFVAYYRVSTARQGQSGLGLEAQKTAVQQHLRGAELLKEFTEVESGKNNDRPELQRALRLCRLRGATLIIAKLDRLARNVHFISGLMESKVEFVAVDFPQANRLTIHILAAVAEHEAAAISQRTKAALAAAKAKGTKLGGRRGTCKIEDYAGKGGTTSGQRRREQVRKFAEDMREVIEEIRAEGITSQQGIAWELNRRGHTAPRGGTWAGPQVMHLLRNLDALTAAAERTEAA